MRARVWLSVLVLLGYAGATGAQEIERTVSRAAWIANPEGEARLLAGFPSVAELEGQWVTSATLTIPLGQPLPADVEVAVEALTTGWAAGATWTSPWTEPGGDFEARLGTSVRLAAGRGGTLTADVTDLVRAMYFRDLKALGYEGGPAALVARKRSAVVRDRRR